MRSISRIFAVIFLGVAPLAAGEPAEDALVVALLGGETEVVGSVTVWTEGLSLHVRYVADDGWVLDRTHLAVASDWTLIPQRGGNPQPGRFEFGDRHRPAVTEFEYEIPLVAPASDLLHIAAYASVSMEGGPRFGNRFDAWADGDEFPGSGWAMYVPFAVRSDETGGLPVEQPSESAPEKPKGPIEAPAKEAPAAPGKETEKGAPPAKKPGGAIGELPKKAGASPKQPGEKPVLGEKPGLGEKEKPAKGSTEPKQPAESPLVEKPSKKVGAEKGAKPIDKVDLEGKEKSVEKPIENPESEPSAPEKTEGGLEKAAGGSEKTKPPVGSVRSKLERMMKKAKLGFSKSAAE